MTENKTKATGASVDDYIASRASEAQAADCRQLTKMLKRVTGKPPKMWGPSIVGFGSYTYKYDSGRTGEAPLTGFAIRGADLVLYLVAEGEEQERLLAKVGKHKIGKSCFYFKRLSDLDASVLEKLVANCIAETRRRYAQEA